MTGIQLFEIGSKPSWPAYPGFDLDQRMIGHERRNLHGAVTNSAP
jgi:hypothetical protein